MTRALQEVAAEEGVTIAFERASIPDRVSALVIDLLLLGVGLLLAFAAASATIFVAGEEWGGVLMILAAFFAFFGWFAWCEAGRRGATPGKRIMRLRVVDRAGRVLTPEAAFARNAIRWFELAGPISVVVMAANDVKASPIWLMPLWLTGFSLTALVRKDGRRLGDLVAGTVVVRNPVAGLRAELVGAAPPERRGVAATVAAAPTSASFTDAQLEVYGERELHALEELLRSPPGYGRADRVAAAATIIAKRVGAEAPDPRRAELWLRDFYAAQRARLERRLALGRRKADKHGK